MKLKTPITHNGVVFTQLWTTIVLCQREQPGSNYTFAQATLYPVAFEQAEDGSINAIQCEDLQINLPIVIDQDTPQIVLSAAFAITEAVKSVIRDQLGLDV